jgi:hypothetical protein
VIKVAEIQVKVSSITNATRGERLLHNNGFSAQVKRSSELEPGNGCGYSIFFSGDKDAGVEILRKAGIRIVEVTQR